MRVGFIQIKVIFGHKQENLEKVTNFILQNAADLLVIPELFNSGYLFSSVSELKALAEPIPDGPTTTVLIQLARDHCVYLVAGLPERDGEKFYNTAILVGPQGFLGCYRKLHLFDAEKKWFTPGDRPPAVYDIGLAKIGIMICFDWIFPEVARTLALNGADLICHPSNLILPHCQKAMITRSLENRIFTITANRIGTEKIRDQQLTFTGYSQITDPLGNLLLQSTTDEKLGVVEIEPGLARNKIMTPNNDLFQDRRPNFYRL